MTKVQARPDELRQFASRFHAVQSELERAGVVFNDSGALASAAIDRALEDFNDAWSHHRKQLVEDLAEAASFLVRAAAALEEQDRLNARRFDPPGRATAGSTSSPSVGAPETGTSVSVPDPATYSYELGQGGYSKWGFAPNNCTDYTAWAINRMLASQGGGTFINDMKTGANGTVGPAGKFGHANTWGNRAAQLGWPPDETPKVGAVAWSTAGSKGHVMIVKAVNSDGTIVTDSYNGHTGKPDFDRKMTTAGLKFIHIVPGT